MGTDGATFVPKVANFHLFRSRFALRRLRSDLLNPKFGSQKSALL